MSNRADFDKMCPPGMRIFLCGDVMLGRGIDQALPYACAPGLYEEAMESAVGYLRLAERANGPILRPLNFADVWGAAMEEWSRMQPHARVINLETSITRSDAYDPKGINYRMSHENAGCLTAAAFDCCVLANNHVLDWGRAGLLDTLARLEQLHIKNAGAGRDLRQASAPAILEIAGHGRLIVLSFALVTSGVPRTWAAKADAAGVNLLPALSRAVVGAIADQVDQIRQPKDVIIVSIHWGPNWGYEITEEQRWFAHELIERGGISILHGHSSHHAKAIEVYKNRLILHGCGDFLNDYEGIGGHEEFRDDLALMYFAHIDPASADLVELEMVPLQIRGFQLIRASHLDVSWLQQTLDRDSQRLGARVSFRSDGRLTLSWARIV
jgi:poly-gamma-glutamate capsule biosynthesis protein CapA/YwtB (metallophosphatase superfamily)